MHKLTVLSALLLSTSIASADLAVDVSFDMGMYAGKAVDLERGSKRIGYSDPLQDKQYTIAGCYKVIADARAAGFHGEMKDGQFEYVAGVRVADGHHYVQFEKATHDICDRFARAHRIAEAGVALEEPRRELGYLVDGHVQGMVGKGAEIAAMARTCSATLDALVAAGAPSNVKIPDVDLTIAEGKATVCEPLATRALTLDAEAKAESQAAYDASANPLKQAGISGERLEFLLNQGVDGFYGVDAVSLDTPAKLAKAKVLFRLSGSNDSGWTLRRFQFTGNKLTKTTFDTFLIEPGSRAYH